MSKDPNDSRNWLVFCELGRPTHLCPRVFLSPRAEMKRLIFATMFSLTLIAGGFIADATDKDLYDVSLLELSE